MTPDEARGEFDPEVVYCNTATLGLPPRRTIAALESTLADWRSGRSDAVGFDVSVERARSGSPAWWASARIPWQSEVSSARSSGWWPLPCHRAVRSSSPRASSRRSASRSWPRWTGASGCGRPPWAGWPRPLGPVPRWSRCRRSSHPMGPSLTWRRSGPRAPTTAPSCWWTSPRPPAGCLWTPGASTSRCAGATSGCWPRAGPHSWSPRRRRRRGWFPHGAGWYAGADRWDSIYGTPLRLAGDARRFDISPAWHSWVGQAESLDLLSSIDPAALQAHCVGLANRFRRAAGLPPGELGHREPEGDPRRCGPARRGERRGQRSRRAPPAVVPPGQRSG